MSSLLTKSIVQLHRSRVSPIQLRDFPSESPTLALVGAPNDFERRVATNAQDAGRATGSHQYRASSRTQSDPMGLGPGISAGLTPGFFGLKAAFALID